LVREVVPGAVYHLGPLFSPAYCAALRRELHRFNGDAALTRAGEAAAAAAAAEIGLGAAAAGLRGRPNSMNRHGVLLDEAGLTPLLTDALLRAVRPLAAALLPDAGGATLDHHRAFTVTYEPAPAVAAGAGCAGSSGGGGGSSSSSSSSSSSEGAPPQLPPARGDRQLGRHFDNAEVTLNVNLGEPGFAGGDLEFFGDKWGGEAREPPVRYAHRVGEAVLHAGWELHAATPLRAGSRALRTNLIVWMRSSAFREQNGCAMCGRTDQLRYGVLLRGAGAGAGAGAEADAGAAAGAGGAEEAACALC
jgi:hypothetical protein